MTTTAFDDQLTPATQTILRVNVIESQQQIHNLQTRLAAAIERAEKAEEKLTTARDDMQSWIDSRNGWMERAGAAEAKLKMLREQKPVVFLPENWRPTRGGGVVGSVFSDGHFKVPLYADTASAVVPAELLSTIQSAINIFQRYTELHRDELAAKESPTTQVPELADGSDDYYEFLGSLVESHPAGVMHHNTAHAPAVPDEWKQAVSEFLSAHDAAWVELFKSLPADTGSVLVSNQQADAVNAANVLRALLQSAEVRHD